MSRKVLILGASGRFGKHAAAAFRFAGWQVTPFRRGGDDLMQAASGQDVIVYGWNPAYPQWRATVPGQVASVIAAARAAGATIILPANVYVFGPDSPDIWSETTPHRAGNPLGTIRRNMETALRQSGVQTILLRSGDFLDTEASGNWFDGVLTKRLSRGRFTYPGRLDVPHAWAYLPDLARATVALAEMRDTLTRFEDIPFPGYTLTGQEMADGLARATGRDIAARPMSWWPLHLARPVWPLARHLLEMRYLWNKPHRLDGARLADLLPAFRATPLDTALASAIQRDVHPDEAVTRNALRRDQRA